MTAKEKAKELIQKYFDLFNNLGYYASLSEGKACALIAVDEVINALNESLINADIEWFEQVKQEIEAI